MIRFIENASYNVPNIIYSMEYASYKNALGLDLYELINEIPVSTAPNGVNRP